MNQAKSFGFELDALDATQQGDLSKLEQHLNAQQEGVSTLAYRAPWRLSGELTVKRLQAWNDYHVGVLRLKSLFGERLRVVRGIEIDADAVALNLAAVLFDRWFPELWDVFESLELLADLPPDGEPLFRACLGDLDSEGALAMIASGAGSASVEASQNLRNENEALLLELEQTQQALEQQFSEAEIARSETDRLRSMCTLFERELADLKREREGFLSEIAALHEAIASTELSAADGAQDIQAEHEFAQLRVQALEEALEKQFLLTQMLEDEAIAARDSLREARNALMAQLRVLQS